MTISRRLHRSALNRSRRAARTASREAVDAYVATVRRDAPTLAAAFDESALVRTGAALLVLAATSTEALSDATSIATEFGATREDLAVVYAAAAAFLSPQVFGEATS